MIINRMMINDHVHDKNHNAFCESFLLYWYYQVSWIGTIKVALVLQVRTTALSGLHAHNLMSTLKLIQPTEFDVIYPAKSWEGKKFHPAATSTQKLLNSYDVHTAHWISTVSGGHLMKGAWRGKNWHSKRNSCSLWSLHHTMWSLHDTGGSLHYTGR